MSKEIKSIIPDIGGFGESKEDTVKFLEYKMRRISDCMEFNLEELDIFDMEHSEIEDAINNYVDENFDNGIYGSVFRIIDEKFMLIENSEDNRDEAIDKISTEATDIIMTALVGSVIDYIERIIKGIKRSPIECIETTIYRPIENGTHDVKAIFDDIDIAVGATFMSAILSTINQIDIVKDVKSIAEGFNGSIFRDEAEEGNVHKEFYKLIFTCVEYASEICLMDSFDKISQNAKKITGKSDDNFIIHVPFNFTEVSAYMIKKPASLNKQNLLASLCNLYIETKDESSEVQGRAVMKWCEKFVYPYNFNLLKNAAEANKYAEIKDYEWYYLTEKRNLLFELKKFYSDLRNLVESTIELLALIEMRNEDRKIEKEAEETPTKSGKTISRREPKRLGVRNLLNKSKIFNSKEVSKFIEVYDGNVRAGKSNFKSFMSSRILGNVPTMQVGLKYSPTNGNIILEPSANSVFDLAWYALMRGAVVMDEYMSATSYDDKKTCIAFCQYCYNFYVKKGNKQKYCEEDECQLYKNRRGQRTYDEQKRLNKEGGSDE